MRHKGFVDTSPPKQYPHLVLRLKQVQKEEERQAEIDHANQLLLHKMTDIMRKKGRVDNWNEYDAKRYVCCRKELFDSECINFALNLKFKPRASGARTRANLDGKHGNRNETRRHSTRLRHNKLGA